MTPAQEKEAPGLLPGHCSSGCGAFWGESYPRAGGDTPTDTPIQAHRWIHTRACAHTHNFPIPTWILGAGCTSRTCARAPASKMRTRTRAHAQTWTCAHRHTDKQAPRCAAAPCTRRLGTHSHCHVFVTARINSALLLLTQRGAASHRHAAPPDLGPEAKERKKKKKKKKRKS